MHHIRPGSPLGRRCPCGALPESGMKRCRKCRARSRWVRRKASRSPSIQRARRYGHLRRPVSRP